MFEEATRMKLRITSVKGTHSVEDLWGLPLTSARGVSLDSLAINLNSKIKTDSTSFVETVSKTDSALELSFSIVKHIIKVKLDERAANENKLTIKTEKEKLLKLIANKEEEADSNLSVEELKIKLSKLGD